MGLEDGDWDFYYTYDCGKHNFNRVQKDLIYLCCQMILYVTIHHCYLVLIVGICRRHVQQQWFLLNVVLFCF